MSSFVFEGIIIAQGETQSGQSQNGNKWMKVWYTIQQDQEKFPMKMVFEIFGEERLRKFALKEGERVRLRFRIDTKKYKDRVTPKEEWVDGIEADCEKKGIPLFMGSSIEAYASNPKKQYPEKLKTKELSSIRKGIYETDCNACGKHGMKREMCALSVQYGRGGPRYALGYLCHDCLDAWIEEYKLNDVPKQ